MSEATIVGAVVTALEPAAAQILEDLHAKWSAEITILEAEAPARIAAAEQDVQDHIGKLINALHGHLADLDAKRAGASTKPTQLPASNAAGISGPVTVGPGPHQGVTVAPGQTGTASNEATPAAAKPSA